MRCESVPSVPHNSHNAEPTGPAVDSVDCVHGLGQIQKLLTELRALGVRLSIGTDGRLSYDAPAGVLTEVLLGRMRAHREALLALVERVEERAAVIEYDGGRSRDEAERLAWAGVVPSSIPEPQPERCPWCGPVDLLDVSEGLRCVRCERLAWVIEGKSLTRADWLEVDLEGVPWESVPGCPSCGRTCDRETLAGRWCCSTCDPEAGERGRQSERLLEAVRRARARAPGGG